MICLEMHLREPGFNYSTCGLFKRMFVDLFPHYYKTLALEKKFDLNIFHVILRCQLNMVYRSLGNI